MNQQAKVRISRVHTLKYLELVEIVQLDWVLIVLFTPFAVVVTFKGVQGFAGADGGQGLLIVKLIVKLRRGGGGVGVGVGFDLNL